MTFTALGPVRGPLVLVLGGPASGKTTLLREAADIVARSGTPVLFFSLAQPMDELGLGPPVDIRDTPGTYVDEICAAMEALPAGAWVVIDYLQLVELRAPPWEHRRASIIRSLRSTAAENGLLALLASQTSRSHISDPRELRDLARSPKWLAEADSIVCLPPLHV